MPQSSSFVDSSRGGVLVLTAFALVWAGAAVGLSSIPTAGTVAAAALVLLAAVAVNAVAVSRHFPPTGEADLPLDQHRRRTVYLATNIAQAVLFSVLISVCIALGELAYIPLIGSLIVGAHFVPLGLSFGELSYLAGGGLLILTGLAGIVVSTTPLTTAALATGVVSLTNAAVLISLAGLQVHLHSTQGVQEQAAS